MHQKQVDKEHYIFSKYMDKARWSSIWHQLNEVSKLSPDSVLEIGPGLGTFKANATIIGLNVETLDLDPELNPDHVASATNLPFESQSYDIVCAFQMLEHLPFKDSLIAFSEMCRVSKRYIIISLPDQKIVYPWRIHIPKLGVFWINIPKPSIKLKPHTFDGEHYWEVNKKGYDLNYVKHKLLEQSHNIKLSHTYRVEDNPYHRFLVFEKS